MIDLCDLRLWWPSIGLAIPFQRYDMRTKACGAYHEYNFEIDPEWNEFCNKDNTLHLPMAEAHMFNKVTREYILFDNFVFTPDAQVQVNKFGGVGYIINIFNVADIAMDGPAYNPTD